MNNGVKLEAGERIKLYKSVVFNSATYYQ